MALTKQQLIARKQGIGGSDAAVLLGKGKYRTPLDLFFDKLDTGEPVNTMDYNPKMAACREWGDRLEGVIIQKFQDETGWACIPTEKEALPVKHPDHPFMLANIDAFIPCQNAVLEIKTREGSAEIKSTWGEPLTDDIPVAYLIQCAHYAEVMNVAKVYIAVLIGGNDFRIYKYDRNRLGNVLIQKEHEFWHNNILKRVPPAPINRSDANNLWLESFKEGSVYPTPELDQSLEHMKAIKSRINELQCAYEKHSLKIFDALQDKNRLVDYQGNTLATWNVQNTCRFDVNSFKKEHPDLYKNYTKTTKSRILRLK